MELIVRIAEFLKREEGQDLVEYALLLGLIALVCVLAITAGGEAVQAIWEAINASLQAVV
jgi:pilus assembly protein Flp/PilA